MLFRTHAIFGFLTALLTYTYFAPSSIETRIFFFIFLLLGAIFPDIDIHNSKINNKLKLSKLIAAITKHRGIFHSLIMALLLSYLLYTLRHYIGIAFFIGYLSHLLIDGLNLMGVNLIHPIQKLHLSGPIKVGSTAEHILTIAFAILVLIKLKFIFF